MKNHFISLLLAIFELIASSSIGSADDIIVDNGSSIQAAVDNATTGDCIIVGPGIYNENIEINDKSLTLRSKSGNANTIINGHAHTSTYADINIDGFTFKGSDSGVVADCATYTVKNSKLIQCSTGFSVGDGGNIISLNNQFKECGIGIFGMPFSYISAENNVFIDCNQMIFDPQYENTIDLKNNTEIHSIASNHRTVTSASHKDSRSVTSSKTQEAPAKSSKNPTTSLSNEDSKSVTLSKAQEAPANPSTKNAVPTEYPSKSTSSNTPLVSGSSSDSSNIQKKEIAQAIVTSGENTTVNFTNNTTCVESITFTSDEMIGEILVTVEELKNNLDSSLHLPEAEIYKFFSISIETDDLNSIRNSSINFSVNNSWIQENNINQSLIALNEYNNTSEEWEKMPLNISGNNSQALHFTANVPSYSFFAITANESNTTSAGVTA